MPRQPAGKSEVSGIAKRRAAAKAEASEHYTARRRDILEAAAAVFRAKGLASTSIDDIAKAAGVDRATLYYYVGSKDELFRDVVIEAVVNNIQLAEKIAGSEDPPEEKLQAVIAGVMGSYAQFYPHIFVFLREDAQSMSLPADKEVDIVDLSRRFDRALMAIVREGVDAGTFRSDVSPKLAAYGIIGMLNWTHRWFDPDGLVDASDVARAFATMAIEGLRLR
jgi:AcrR family transcriptional regulator